VRESVKPDIEDLGRRTESVMIRAKDLKVSRLIGDPNVARAPDDPALTRLALAVEGLELAERQNELVSADPNSLEAKLAELRLQAARAETEIQRQMVEMNRFPPDRRSAIEFAVRELRERQIALTRQMLELLEAAHSRMLALGLYGWQTRAQASLSITIPMFWPVPKPSSIYVLPAEYFRRSADQVLHLRDVNERIRRAMTDCGYVEWSYFAVPDGFALVTRLEQIEEDGAPKEPGRWSAKIKPLEFGRASFRDYVRALFTANAGYYRIIVFVVTQVPLAKTDVPMSRSEAMAWLDGGFEFLPEEIGRLEYAGEYHCTALVYEFEQSNPGTPPDPSIPGRLPAYEHLRMARLLAVLGE
jgi:hypothetical protein